MGKENDAPEAGKVAGPVEEQEPNLPHLLGRTVQAIRQMMEKELGVNVLTARVMFTLGREDGATQNHLTGALGVDPSMITRTVKELEHGLGWVRRERDPQDNRLMRVFLTGEGRKQAESLGRQVKEVEQLLTGNLSPADLRQLRDYLLRLEETARSHYQADRPDPAEQD